MADRYFKKSKEKFKVGYSDTVFKYNFSSHKIESLEERFIECDKDGKELKKEKPKAEKPKAKKESSKKGSKK